MAARTTSDRERWILYALGIIAVAGILRFYNIGWSFSNNGIDEGIMLQRSSLVAEGYALYAEIPCDQAPLAFLVGGALGGEIVPLRALVASMSLVAIAACMWASSKSRGKGAMLVTGALLALDFAFVRESRLFSLDALAASFIALSLVPVVLHVRDGRAHWLALAGLMLGLSAAMKLHGAVALVGLLLFVVLEARKAGLGTAATVKGLLVLLLPAAAPLVALLVFLGPADALDGMLLGQAHREFEPFLKLSVAALFGLNVAYALPLAYARRLWGADPATRAILLMASGLLAYTLLQPLVFLHHMVLLSPPLAFLAGIVISDAFEAETGDSKTCPEMIEPEKARLSRTLIAAFLVANIAVSGSLCAFGLAAQDEPYQSELGELLRSVTDADDWVISGDPIIATYADRMIPPEMVNVAYRRYPDLTLSDVEDAVVDYDVQAVVVCYRLNDMDGLPELLESNGFVLIAVDTSIGADTAVLDLFQDGIGNVTVYVRQN